MAGDRRPVRRGIAGAGAVRAGSAAARVENKVPSATVQEVLIKTTLLTLNDANITGDYGVLHARLAKPFREQFSAEKLKSIFQSFRDKHVDYGIIAASRRSLPARARSTTAARSSCGVFRHHAEPRHL